MGGDDRAALEARLHAAEKRLQVVSEVHRALAVTSHEPGPLMAAIAERFSTIIGDNCTICLLTEDRSHLEVITIHDPNAARLGRVKAIAMPAMDLAAFPQVLQAIEHADITVLSGEALETLVGPSTFRDALRASGIRTLMLVPLRGPSGPLGLLTLGRHREGATYNAEDIELARAIADHAAIMVEQHLTRASAAQLRALIESSPDGIVILDARSRIVLVNARTEALFGHPRDALVGHCVGMLIPERLRERQLRDLAGYIDESTHRIVQFPLTAMRADGTELPTEVSMGPIDTPRGRLVSCTIRDVTAHHVVEAALRRANRELEAFSYSVAHDLRAPLRGLDGFGKLLLEASASLPPELRDYCEEIVANASRMATLVDALLELSRLTTGELRVEPVDLSALAAELASELAAAEPGRVVEVRIAPGMTCRADPRLLRVVITNLLANARKFTARVAHPVVEIGTSIERRVRAWYVRDNGAGFDPRYRDKLFGPFQRLHSTREFPGTGIGLATVQRIVHRHGGQIWAESEPGRGATFFFTLADPTAGAA